MADFDATRAIMESIEEPESFDSRADYWKARALAAEAENFALAAIKEELAFKVALVHELLPYQQRAIKAEEKVDALRKDREELMAVGNMLSAVVEGAQQKFVKVPYGASHEDVAQINGWHEMAKEAQLEFAGVKRYLRDADNAARES